MVFIRKWWLWGGAVVALAWFIVSAEPAISAEAGAAKSTFVPAVLYLHAGNDNDRAFIDAAKAGVERSEKELGIHVSQYRIKGTENPAVALKRVADSGATHIIAVGYEHVMPVLNMAERYPNVRFTVVDGLVPPLYPNVQSVIFKDHEGAFLVGFIAAKISTHNHIGFVGGMDIPLIRNFEGGYMQGAKYANPGISVDAVMLGNTPDAWSEPDKAHAHAIDQYAGGADVIFAAAGGSGLGVLKAASETGKYAIGVDTNQNGLFPGHVLTSMVKRVDLAVYDALKLSREGKWSPGIKYLGIKEGMLDYAVDESNRNLISENLIEEVATAKEKIINGLITVDMYTPR